MKLFFFVLAVILDFFPFNKSFIELSSSDIISFLRPFPLFALLSAKRTVSARPCLLSPGGDREGGLTHRKTSRKKGLEKKNVANLFQLTLFPFFLCLGRKKKVIFES